MLFSVQSRKAPAPKLAEYPHVVLHEDNWDDYGYKTTYAVTLHKSQNEDIDLGHVKILYKGQTSGYTPLPAEPFPKLSPDFCSLGGNLEYYEKLYKEGPAIYKAFLRGLRDVAFSDEVRAKFEDHEGYKVSLLRFSGAERTIADVAKLFARTVPLQKRRGSGFVVKFKTQVATQANTFTIDFDFRRKGGLPHRMNVLIGYNGTGKTRLLSNLAIVASGFGYAKKEDVLADRAGRFVGNLPPFKTVVVVSYSAFDNFVIPGRNEIEKARLQDEGAIFGYVYCGLRERADITDEDNDIRAAYRLKTPDEIEQEFVAALLRVRDAERREALVDILRPLLRDASFQRIGLTPIYTGQDDNALMQMFRGLSSGHKIVLKIVIDLIAHMDSSEPTLVLIDEPETHLHPPLLAALLKSVRACLDHFDGYAILSTHSPVVLQETPSRYVHVLKRVADNSQIAQATIETFGENIGVITQDVFNLDDGSTDWHDTLRNLAQTHSLEQIEELFDRRLGFGPRSYVIGVREDEEG